MRKLHFCGSKASPPATFMENPAASSQYIRPLHSSSSPSFCTISGMATITSVMTTSTVPRSTVLMLNGVSGSRAAPVLGLPCMRACGGRVKSSVEGKKGNSVAGVGLASTIAALSATVVPNPAVALVDERLSTEGTGLSLGLSNNLLGWILLGVFGLIWSLYIVYTSSLDEDEDSGLSL